MEPHSRMTNKKEVNFPSICRIYRSTADLPCRVAESVSPTEKEEHVIRLRWPQRGIRGWPSAILSLENSLSVVSQDTAASPPDSSEEEDTVQGEWCVAPWAPPLSPALPLLLCPAPCLTTGTLPLESRSSCSPLTFRSCFHSLHSHHTQTARRGRSGRCRSTWSSRHCSHLLL